MENSEQKNEQMESTVNLKIPHSFFRYQVITTVIVMSVSLVAVGLIIWMGQSNLERIRKDTQQRQQEIREDSQQRQQEIREDSERRRQEIREGSEQRRLEIDLRHQMTVHANALHEKLDLLIEKIDDLKRELEERKGKEQTEPQSREPEMVKEL